MYVIAVDADGVKEQQKSLNSIASFEFVNKNGQSFNYSSNFTEFMETSFQHYSYTLPALEEDDEGNYTLTLSGLLYNILYIIVTCNVYLQMSTNIILNVYIDGH